MEIIQKLPIVSQAILYILLALMFLHSVIIFVWQVQVIRGRAMKNADGSFDSWHEQKNYYGIALADVLLSCPINILGILLVFISPRWEFYLISLVSFWWLWANTMTTANSLKFEKPKMTFYWVISFPFGIFIGLSYIVFTFVHFDVIFGV